jgi:geranylgeranyl diphosphate synthase type II
MDDYYKNLTDRVNQSLLQGINPGKNDLEGAVYYSLSVKGKRFRPLLFLSLIEGFGQSPTQYIDIACGIEYIHTYSLIHDDLPTMDNDDFRRGMPTVHKQFNEPIALLAGDTLLTLAIERISQANISEQKTVRIIRILTSCIGLRGMAGGQAMDLEFKGEKEKIFRIQRMKTADLIRGTLLSAAEVLDMTDVQKKTLDMAGVFIGIAFQMADDLLDVIGDEYEVGKKLHKDALNKSPNSVVFYGREFIEEKIDFLYQKTMEKLREIKIEFPPFLNLIKKMAYRSR